MRSPDVPRRRVRTTRGRLGLLVAAVVIFILIISLRGIAGFYTDYLWFQELHLTSVWRSVLGAKLGLAVLFTVIFFVLMWVNLAIADRIAPAFRPMGPEEELVERYHQVVGPRAALVRTAVAALFALIAGPSVAGRWNSWILFRNHVSFGIKDPPAFFRGIGDLQNRLRSERMPRPVRLGCFEIELPNRCDAISSQYHQRKVFRKCAVRGHDVIPSAFQYRGKSGIE